MSILAVRISDQDKSILAEYARFNGKSMSAMARDILIEKIEDYEDMKAIEEHEKEKQAGTVTYMTLDEVIEECGLTGEV